MCLGKLKYSSNQLQPLNKLFSKDLQKKVAQTSVSLQMNFSQRICKEGVSNLPQPPNELFSKDLWRNMLQTSSSLQTSFSQRICKGKCFKPAPASKRAFLKGCVKDNASSQLQPPNELSLKDLLRRMHQTSSSLQANFS